MPAYDYYCDANEATVSVRHSMSQTVQTWGELCTLAGLATGDTPANTPVRRVISGGMVLTNKPKAVLSGGGHCCGGGCGHPGH